MAQNWFVPKPFSMVEGKRPAIFKAFDDLQLQIKDGFDAVAGSATAAIFGIEGSVDLYSELPDPDTLYEKTIFIVRQSTGAPDGNGLYWVKESGGVKQWEFLDSLSLQDATEVPYDNTVSGIPSTTVQEAIDWAIAHGGGGGDSSVRIYTYSITTVDVGRKYMILPSRPSTEGEVMFFVQGGPSQINGLDFSVNVSDNRLFWGGLALDDVIEEGDNVTVFYKE